MTNNIFLISGLVLMIIGIFNLSKYHVTDGKIKKIIFTFIVSGEILLSFYFILDFPFKPRKLVRTKSEEISLTNTRINSNYSNNVDAEKLKIIFLATRFYEVYVEVDNQPSKYILVDLLNIAQSDSLSYIFDYSLSYNNIENKIIKTRGLGKIDFISRTMTIKELGEGEIVLNNDELSFISKSNLLKWIMYAK